MDSEKARRTLVEPFYMQLMFGDLAELDDLAGFERSMIPIARSITDHDAVALFYSGWREAEMASWWSCIRRFENSERRIRHALDPRVEWNGYPGLVHFVALAKLDSEESREVLRWALKRRVDHWDRAAAVASAKMLGIDVRSEVEGLDEAFGKVGGMLALARRVSDAVRT